MLTRIISGGQTGVDRSALDAAKRLGIDRGGWCPLDRIAEDFRIPDEYPLTETPSSHYPQRTAWNVRDADATLLIAWTLPLSRGTDLTWRIACASNKPRLLVPIGQRGNHAADAAAWLESTRPATLNIAGPRESSCPGIHAAALAFLLDVLRPFAKEG